MGIEEQFSRIEQVGTERGWVACKNAASIVVLELGRELLEGKLDPTQLYAEFKARFPTMREYLEAGADDAARESGD